MKSSCVAVVVLLIGLGPLPPVFAQRPAGRGGRAQSSPSQPQGPATTKTEYPTATIKTVDVAKDVRWEYGIWTDATGKHQVRAKPLSLEDGTVRFDKKHGGIIQVSVDKLSADDHELLSKGFGAQKSPVLKEDALAAFLAEVNEAGNQHPEETALRRESLEKQQQEKFLDEHNGKDFELQFRIEDIAPYNGHTGGGRGGRRAAPVPGCYLLRTERGKYSPALNNPVVIRLSQSEAEWVSKGDTLSIRGKSHFLFANNDQQSICFWTGFRGGALSLRLEKPLYTIFRERDDTSLADKIKAKGAELRAIEAKEEEAKHAEEKHEADSNPFNGR